MTTHNSFPRPPHLSGLAWRPATMDDVAPVHQLLLDIDAHDGRHWAGTLADMKNEFLDPNMDLRTDTLVGFMPDGRVAALGWVYAPKEVEQKHRASVFPDLHPDHRQPAIEDFLMAWCEARGRQILHTRNDGLPRLLRGSAMALDHTRIAWYQRHGFEIIRYFYEMRRDLSQPIAEPVLPAGFTFENWTPELDQRTCAAFNESFRDHWGFEPVSKETWNLYFTGRSSFRPDLSYLIMAGEEVAGFSINFLSPEENERKGIQEAWVGDLGVRRPWRKQGLATALLNQSMRVFKDAGMDYASLGVDTQNPTGALGVYERVGFAAVKSSVSLGKPVEAEAAHAEATAATELVPA